MACTGGQVCDPETGQCVDDPCEEVSCPHPQVCIDGHCTDDTCAFIECPEGFTCVGDTCVEGVAPPDEVAPDVPPDASTGPLYVTGTGGGGCGACALAGQTPAAESGAAWTALLLLAGTLLIASRRRGSVYRVAAAAALLLALASSGCHADYECLANCDVIVEGDGEDAGDDGRDTDANVDGAVQEGDDIPAEEVPR